VTHSWSVYRFWLPTFPSHFLCQLFHPKYILATTRQVAAAFIKYDTPMLFVHDLEHMLAPCESMCWPIQAIPPIVTGPDFLSLITGWKPRTAKIHGTRGITPRLLVLAAEYGILCTTGVLRGGSCIEVDGELIGRWSCCPKILILLCFVSFAERLRRTEAGICTC
jgi:hypothetical protein